jgi:hypothetical protein
VAYEAGTAVLEVVPSFKGIEQMLAKGARDIAQGLDKTLGGQLGKAMESATEKAEAATGRAGRKLGMVFAERAIKQVESALGNIPDSDRVLKPLRAELEALSKIDLGKGFDEKAFIARLEKVHDALKRAQQDAQGVNAIGRYTNAGNAAQALGAAKQMIDEARRRGFEAGDAWTNAFQARLRAMRTALPDLKIRAGSTQEERARASSPAERQAAAIRSRVETVQQIKPGDIAQEGNPLSLPIGVKVSREDLAREMATIEGILDNFIETFQDSDLVFPVDKARQQAGAFFEETKTQAQKAAEAEAQAYLNAMEDAYREQAKRDRQFREERARANDEAIKEQYKRDLKARQDFNRDFDAAVKESYMRQRKAQSDVDRDYDAAIKEQFLRDKKARDDYARDFDAAIVEDYKRQKRERDQFGRDYDAAVKEDFLRQKRTQADFLRDWDAAILADHKRQLKEQADFAKMYDDALLEDYKVQRRRQEEFNRDFIAGARENARRQAELLRGTTAGDAQEGTRKAAGAIQDVPVRLQTRAIDQEMAAIRARIAALGDIEIGVTMGTDDFADDVEREFRRLKKIARDQSVDIKVRTDAAKAATELGGILVLLNRIDKDKATVKVDTSGAVGGLAEMLASLSLNLGRLGALVAVGASIGTAMVPAAAAAASAIGAIGTAGLASAAGLGVMMLAFSGIGDAVSAMSKAADDQEKAAASTGRSANQIASAQDQVRSAEMSLANTRRNNAQSALRAQRAIRDAIEDQRDAVRDVARANQDAVERYSAARRDATRADLDAERAQESMTEAYRAARRAIEDLNSAIRGNALDQRQAALDIAKAKEDLNKALTNPRATEAEIEQARISYEQRLLQMDDLKRKAGEMSDEQEKRFAVGIKGSEEVKQAEEKIADASERSKNAQRDLKKAAEDVTRTRIDGQEKLRDAQQKVADAQRAAADQQADAAYSMFTANQGLVSAQRSLAAAYNTSATAGGAALDTLRDKLANMTPAGRAFATYIFGLKDAFLALKTAADPVLGGLQTAMTSLIGATSDEATQKLGPLFDFVQRVSSSIGGMFVRLSNTLRGPTFKKFFGYVSKTAVPTLERMYTAFENILVGVTNLFLAFTPLSGDVEDGFVGMTKSFRKWSEGLETNKGFKEFLKYLKDSGPQVVSFLKEVFKGIGKLVVAAAPVGTLVIKGFTKLFNLINKIPEDTLIALVAGISAAATAIGVFAAVTAAVTLGIPGAIAAAVAGLVIGFSVLVGSSKGVREALMKAWEGIKAGLAAAWAVIWPLLKGLGKIFKDLWAAAMPTLKQIGGMFVWLWNNAILPAAKGIWVVIQQLWETIKPVFEGIIAIIKPVAQIFWWLMKNIIIPVVAAIVWVLVKTLTPVFKFLWKFVIQPILKSIGLAFSVLMAIVKVVVGIILIALKAFGMYMKFLYEKLIKPVWKALVDNVFRPMGEWIEKNIAPAWNKAMKKLGSIWAGLKKMLGVPIKFVVETLLNDGLLKGYNWLADKFNVEPKNVQIPAPKGGWTGFATGGAVYGRGTETSDSIPARLSRGEHVLTAKEVRAAGGHDVIYQLRRAILAGQLLPGFARGGAVGNGRGEIGDNFGNWLKKIGKGIKDKATDAFSSAAAFVKDPLGSIKALAKALLNKVPGRDTAAVQQLLAIPKKVLATLQEKVTGLFSGGGGQDGVGNGVSGYGNNLGGSGGMIAILRRIFPGLNLNSGLRPGAITATGNKSLHSENRAIDVPPRRDVFEWIRKNYPDSRELIFSPAGGRQLYRGRNHMYTGITKSMHYNHVHWGYDQGGLLPDTRKMPGGVMQVFHGRKTPDKVLTDDQWQNMAALANKARESMRGGDTFNFPYRDSTLDIDELNRWSSRRDALNRVNRVNY